MKVSGLPVIQSYWLMLIATVITIAIVNRISFLLFIATLRICPQD